MKISSSFGIPASPGIPLSLLLHIHPEGEVTVAQKAAIIFIVIVIMLQ